MLLAGTFNRGKSAKIRDNPLFTGNPLELLVNTQNKPIKAGTGNLTSDSLKNQDNPLYRSLLTDKRRHIFLDFVPPFLGILGDNPKKMTIISRLKTVTAIPNVLNQFFPFLGKNPTI